MLKKIFYTALLCVSLIPASQATIVEFQTSQGSIQVNLFDQTTPKTVANFLQYIDEEHYTNSLVHRAVTGFVVQGGGYAFDGTWPLTRLTTNPSVINEPVYSNVKGTISMAKMPGNQNSATDQWFFNLANNNKSLDANEGGYTVFGQVIGDGMAVIEKIAQLKLCNAGTLKDIPMVVNEGQQCADLAAPAIENFVVINSITIIDSAEVTDADLNPVKNTLLNQATNTDNSSGGGVIWFSLFGLLVIASNRFLIRK